MRCGGALATPVPGQRHRDSLDDHVAAPVVGQDLSEAADGHCRAVVVGVGPGGGPRPEKGPREHLVAGVSAGER